MLDAFHTRSEAEKRKKHLHIFIQTRPEETLDRKYYERMLHKFRERARHVKPNYRVTNRHRRRLPTAPPKPSPQDRKVCLAVDESGMSGKGLDDFFSQVNCSIQRYCWTVLYHWSLVSLFLLLDGWMCSVGCHGVGSWKMYIKYISMTVKPGV